MQFVIPSFISDKEFTNPDNADAVFKIFEELADPNRMFNTEEENAAISAKAKQDIINLGEHKIAETYL